jgi:uncharacterized lipoprotein YbaY
MKHLKASGLVAAMALVVACAGAASASATTIDPASTAFSLTGTNVQLAVSGGGTIVCADSIISGTTPSGTTITLSARINLSFNDCNMGGFPATVFVPSACSTAGASPIHLNVKYNGTTAPQASATLTVTSGCTITADIPTIVCTITFSGEQTIGNGTSGTGGIGITNGTSTIKTVVGLNSATIPSAISSGGGFGCPSAGAHTGTLSGPYRVTAPSSNPGITITP